VAEVVAMMSGVPVQRIAKAENLKLLEMAENLKKKVVGQDDAVQKIVKAYDEYEGREKPERRSRGEHQKDGREGREQR
jgi:hypothetical protein